MHIVGKRFSTDEEVEKWTKGLAANYFEEGIKKLIPPVYHLQKFSKLISWICFVSRMSVCGSVFWCNV